MSKAKEAARSPEEWAAKTIHYGERCRGPENMGRYLGLCAFCAALAADFRAAMAQARREDSKPKRRRPSGKKADP